MTAVISVALSELVVRLRHSATATATAHVPRAAERVGHDEDLHEVVVDVARTRRAEDHDRTTTHRLVQTNARLAVGEVADVALHETNVEALGHEVGELAVARASDHGEANVGRRDGVLLWLGHALGRRLQ